MFTNVIYIITCFSSTHLLHRVIIWWPEEQCSKIWWTVPCTWQPIKKAVFFVFFVTHGLLRLKYVSGSFVLFLKKQIKLDLLTFLLESYCKFRDSRRRQSDSWHPTRLSLAALKVKIAVSRNVSTGKTVVWQLWQRGAHVCVGVCDLRLLLWPLTPSHLSPMGSPLHCCVSITWHNITHTHWTDFLSPSPPLFLPLSLTHTHVVFW